jgi:hypothetical protein
MREKLTTAKLKAEAKSFYQNQKLKTSRFLA